MEAQLAFEGFPKMPRLFRDVVLTEKIDGTNAQIYIGEDGTFLVGSRTRWITPENDNMGFAKWATANEAELVAGLGHGRHFGEWWGQGIQRNYGLKEKRFSLFNALRWHRVGAGPQSHVKPNGETVQSSPAPECCHVVPVLGLGVFDTFGINMALKGLTEFGSSAAPGFMNPEGIIAFHIQGGVGFKVTLENDGIPKSLVKEVK